MKDSNLFVTLAPSLVFVGTDVVVSAVTYRVSSITSGNTAGCQYNFRKKAKGHATALGDILYKRLRNTLTFLLTYLLTYLKDPA